MLFTTLVVAGVRTPRLQKEILCWNTVIIIIIIVSSFRLSLIFLLRDSTGDGN